MYRTVHLASGKRAFLRLLHVHRDIGVVPPEFTHERDLAADLPRDVVLPVISVSEHDGAPALVLEDRGEKPLSQLISTPLSPARFLDLAVAIARSVTTLHGQGVVHRALCPQSIFATAEATAARFTEFSLAVNGDRGIPNAFSSDEHFALHSLAYVAPEQTGRINRAPDERADLYALGVIFYEMLTGERPFDSDDPLELVHAHITQLAVPLDSRTPPTPRPISALVERLMAKNPDDRYQRAQSLLRDLEHCRAQYAALRHFDFPFTPGGDEEAASLLLPPRIYGREEEQRLLRRSLARTGAGERVFVLLSGPAGSGKSALAEDLQPDVHARGGQFVVGKFDQYQLGLPLAAVLGCLTTLVRRLLTLDENALESWRERMAAALGSGLSVLVETLPELRAVVGDRPPAPALPQAGTENRLQLALVRFFALLADTDQPLVLVLNDLQWADRASLALLQALVDDPESLGILVIGTVRSEDVDGVAAHPVHQTLAAMDARGAAVVRIQLGPLRVSDVRSFLADALDDRPDQVSPLAEEIHRRTGGNPLFVREFTRYLHAEDLLSLDRDGRRWRWNIDDMDRAGVPESVTDLLLGGLRGLSADIHRTLQLAACLGPQFDAERLAAVCNRPLTHIVTQLLVAADRNLLIPHEDSFHPTTSGDEGTGNGAAGGESRTGHTTLGFRFAHHRVRWAAYSLCPVEDRPKIHLHVGRRLLAYERAHDSREELLFAILPHFDIGIDLIDDPVERADLARLHLRAGRHARAGSAYESAARFYRTGLSLVDPRDWESEYEFAFSMLAEGAESEYLDGAFDRAEPLIDEMLARARSSLDRARARDLHIQLLESLGHSDRALAVGRLALAELDIHLPENADECAELAAREQSDIRARLDRLGDGGVLDGPLVDTPDKRIALSILANLVAPASLSHPSLYALLVTRQVSLSLEFGYAETSPYCLMLYGYYLATVLEHYREATEIGELALRLGERLDARSQQCRLKFVFGTYSHFSRHLRTTLDLYEQAYREGLDSGDFIYLSYACSHTLIARLDLGDPLDEVAAQCERFLELMQRTRVASSIAVQECARQFIANLQGRTRDPSSLSDDTFDEAKFLERVNSAGLSFAIRWFHIARLILFTIHGDHLRARRLLDDVGDELGANIGFFFTTEYPFYAALALTGAIPTAAPEERAAMLESLSGFRSTLNRWAAACPYNYEHRRLVVEAECARISGDDRAATAYYDRALQRAREAGFPVHAALTAERAAAFHRQHGRVTTARLYIGEAHALYARWGATGKADSLAGHFSIGAETAAPATAPSPRPGPDLDQLSVIRASQALAAELELDRLLHKVMRVVVVNAGAQRGVLMFTDGGQLRVMAEARSSGEVGKAAPHLVKRRDELFSDSALAPAAPVLLAHRTGHVVVCEDASLAGPFMSDPYISRHRVRSLLCLPIKLRGEGRGVIYLENNLVNGSFTQERIDVLKLLATQIAISISHAQLYAHLDEARVKAEAANRTKSVFLTNMSHELRTPLNAIVGLSELLVTEEALADNADIMEMLTLILESGHHLKDLIGNVLDFTQIESDTIRISVSRFDIRELLIDIADEFAATAQRNGNTLSLVAPESLGVMCSDESRVRQIIGNVLGNATKFTENGEVKLVAELNRHGGAPALHLEIHDTGIGMSAAQLESAFELFRQADSSSTKLYGGTGMGLTVSRRLCQLLGGEITLASELGVGTVCTLELPVTLTTPAAR